MLVFIVLGAFVVLGLLAGLAQRRAKAIQADPNFAPTDHVEVQRGGFSLGRLVLPTEDHHDDDPPGFQMGD
jgi:hypothetical protein